eukprot:354256-Chlamydomonas_euryale.AAC.10
MDCAGRERRRGGVGIWTVLRVCAGGAAWVHDLCWVRAQEGWCGRIGCLGLCALLCRPGAAFG